MARTRTLGITIDRSSCRTLNKEHRATRIFARLGVVSTTVVHGEAAVC
jgi:hypothetical protein